MITKIINKDLKQKSEFLKRIDNTVKKINKNNLFSDKETDIIDYLINKIYEYGSYWKREVALLNLIKSRDDYITQILKKYALKFGIELKIELCSLNQKSKRNLIINEIFDKILIDCGIY